MEFQSVVDFISNKTILVTGATGFVAKILVEKILRCQPNVKKLYLLLRAKSDKSVLTRLHDEILKKDVFNVLREKRGTEFESFISEKVVPIAGDTSLPDLGIMDASNLCNEIDVIINVAASTNFYERYDRALNTNTFGVRNVVELAKKCPKLQILVHVSTAYVCGEKKGMILEEVCKMGKSLNGRSGLNIEVERKLVDKVLNDLTSKQASTDKIKHTMRRLGEQRARMYGWPNTYVFTKAMGEMLLGENREDVPVAIIRPTMISSTFKDPFPGWIENVGSAAAVTITQGKRYIYMMAGDKNSVLDVIPADMVGNSILMAMVANAKRPNLTIYQVGSSLRNPITLGKLINMNYNYFGNNPWFDAQGMAVKPASLVTKSKLIFILYLCFLLLEAFVFKLVDISTLHLFKINHDLFMTRFKASIKLSELFKAYTLFSGIFDDTNTEKLRTTMRQNDRNERECFNFDPTCIDWDDYLHNVHIPGVVKYLF